MTLADLSATRIEVMEFGFDRLISSSVLIQALGPYTDTHNTNTPKTRTIQNRR